MAGLSMIIQTFGITKRYKNITAVNHIDLSIEEGKIFKFPSLTGQGRPHCYPC